MKNFINYLSESKKTYQFRIKLANVDPKENMDRLKNALDSYGLESLSEAKRLPIKENDIDFPSMVNCQIYLMDAVLKYPVNDAQLRAIVSERACIPQSQIIVVSPTHPEEQRRWDLEGNDVRTYEQGEAVLDKPFPEADAKQKAASKFYSEAGSILKDLTPAKIEIAGTEKASGETTNNLPVGTTSPIKGK